LATISKFKEATTNAPLDPPAGARWLALAPDREREHHRNAGRLLRGEHSVSRRMMLGFRTQMQVEVARELYRGNYQVASSGTYASICRWRTTVGKFYLQAGKLRYRSKRMTPLAMPSGEVLGTASVSEDNGKTVLTLMPEDPNYLGRAEYERVK
jgi:hypothetical protein